MSRRLKNKVCLAASRSLMTRRRQPARYSPDTGSMLFLPGARLRRRPAIPVCVAVFNEALVVFLKSFKTLSVTSAPTACCAALKSLLSASQKRRGDGVCV